MDAMISKLPSFARQSAPEKYAHGIGLIMQSHQTGLSIFEPPSEKFAVQYAEAHHFEFET